MKNRKPLRSVLSCFLAALLLVCSLPVSAAAASSDEIQKDLDVLKDENKEIQAQINAIRSKYDANASEIQDLVDTKMAIDQEISLLNAQIINTNEQIAAYSQMIADSQDELDIAQFTLNGLNEKHKLRIRAMEEEGTVSYWEVIFEANSFIDMLDRITMMQEIAAADQARLEEMRMVAADVEVARTQLETGKAELEQTRIQQDTAQSELEQKRGESDEFCVSWRKSRRNSRQCWMNPKLPRMP